MNFGPYIANTISDIQEFICQNIKAKILLGLLIKYSNVASCGIQQYCKYNNAKTVTYVKVWLRLREAVFLEVLV